MTHRCIYGLVYLRHREEIFWASLIQIYEVHTHSPFSVLLLHHHSTGQPFRVEHFLDSPCLLKFYHPISNSICMFLGWAPRLLLFGNDGWVNI